MIFKKIYFIGESKKIISAFIKIFETKKIEIIPWRKCVNYNSRLSHLAKKDADVIVVCGYDYKSYWYEYNKYIRCNVTEPLKVIKKISNSKTIIFFINTLDDKKKVTCSRYRYAKYLLANLLLNNSRKFKNIAPPTLIDKNGRANIYGGFFYKLIFDLLIDFDIIKTCSQQEFNKLILEAYKNNLDYKFEKIKPKFLKVRRTLFFDRLLRFFYG